MAYVYKISGNGLDYYGSSVQNPVERKALHTSQYRRYLKTGDKCVCSTYKIFDSYENDWETGNWTFEKIKDFDTEQEALEYENLCIINEPCVNTNRAIGLTGDEMRKYKAEWAMNKRRAEGMPERQFIKTEEDKKKYLERTREKNRLHTQEKRANMSAEEKEKELEERRKNQHTEEAKEKNREYLNIPEVKERRRLQQIAKRALKTPEQLAKEAERRKELYQAKKAK